MSFACIGSLFTPELAWGLPSEKHRFCGILRRRRAGLEKALSAATARQPVRAARTIAAKGDAAERSRPRGAGAEWKPRVNDERR